MVNYEKLKLWYERKEKELKGIRKSGYIMYFYDEQNFETIILEELTPVIELGNTKEIFLLDKPSFFDSGLPVFVCLRGYPISVFIEFKKRKIIDTSDLANLIIASKEQNIGMKDSITEQIVKAISKQDSEEVVLIEKKFNSFDLFAKLDSIYINKIFHNKQLDKKYYVFTALMFLLGTLMGYFITKLYFPTETFIYIGG